MSLLFWDPCLSCFQIHYFLYGLLFGEVLSPSAEQFLFWQQIFFYEFPDEAPRRSQRADERISQDQHQAQDSLAPSLFAYQSNHLNYKSICPFRVE